MQKVKLSVNAPLDNHICIIHIWICAVNNIFVFFTNLAGMSKLFWIDEGIPSMLS